MVREAIGEGRLTLDEGDERLAAVYAAKYRDELPPLVTDLPRGQADRRPRRRRSDRRARRPSRRRARWGGPRSARSTPRRRSRAATVGPSARAGLRAGVRAAGPDRPGVVSLATGAHFFWPAVPLIFLGLFLIRGTCLFRYGNAGRRRGWSVPPSI